MSTRTLLIVLGVIAAGLGVVFFLNRRSAAQVNGTYTPPAYGLPPIPPPIGSMGSGGSTSFSQVYGQAAGAAAQAACVANGGGQLCGVAGSVATKVGTVYAATAQKAVTTVYSGAKSLLGKIF